MTDRELLELSARAAGINYRWNEPCGKVEKLSVDGWSAGFFEPLTDDGDALRLAVKLEMDVTHYQNSVEVTAWIDGELFDFISDEISNCRLAATRRAIVRAAAAIGEKL